MCKRIEEIVSCIESIGNDKHSLTIGNYVLETMYSEQLDVEQFEFQTKDIKTDTRGSIHDYRANVTFKLYREGVRWMLYTQGFGGVVQRSVVTTEEELATLITSALTVYL